MEQSNYSATKDCIRTKIHIKKHRLESRKSWPHVDDEADWLINWSTSKGKEGGRIHHKKTNSNNKKISPEGANTAFVS